MDKNTEKSLSEERDTKNIDSPSNSSIEQVDTTSPKNPSKDLIGSEKIQSNQQQTSDIQLVGKEQENNHKNHSDVSKEVEKIEEHSNSVFEENQEPKEPEQSDSKTNDDIEIVEHQQQIDESQEVEILDSVSEIDSSKSETFGDHIQMNSNASEFDHPINTESTTQFKESKIKLESLTELELVSLFEKTIKASDWNKQRSLISKTSHLIKENFQNDFKTRKETYINEGGNQIDFFYNPDYKKQFDRLTRYFQKKKRDHHRNLEKKLQSNLIEKRKLLEQIKELRGQDISIKKKYQQIHYIQDQWHEIGPVPRIKNDQLWKDYNHNLDLFYQLLDVHKTQRDEFDQQHFEKLKLLIEESRNKIESLELNKAKTELETLKILLKIRSGRLGHRLRNEIWDQFKTLRKGLDKKISNVFSTNQQIKFDALNQLQSIHDNLPASHEKWQKCTQDLNNLNSKFRNAHPVSYRVRKKLNSEFYELYWGIIRGKNAYYKEFNSKKKESLEAKNEIIKELETILDSDSWKEKANRVKKLRPKWKEISFTSNRDERRLWNQFNKLNKLYFTRLQQGYEKLTPHQESIHNAKRDFITEIEENFNFDAAKDFMEQLNPKIEFWHGFGAINSDTNHQLNNSFYNVIKQKIKALELTKKEKSEFSFECLLEIIKLDNYSLEENMAQIKSTTDNLIKELTQLENNLQFFDTSSSSNPLVLKTEEKSKRLKERLEFYKQRYSKLKFLKSKL